MANMDAMLKALQSALSATNGETVKGATNPAPNAMPSDEEPYRALHAEIQIVADTPAVDAFDRMREVYAIATAAHAEIYEALKVLEQNKANMPQGMLCDCVFALREAKKKLDDSVSSIEHTSNGVQDMVLLRYVADPMSLESGNVIYGKFCRGKPEYKARAKVPSFSKEPERYKLMMDWLGVPEDLRDRGKELYAEGEFYTKVVDIYYPGLQDMIQKYNIAGYAMPDWLPPNERFNEPCVTVYKLHDLL